MSINQQDEFGNTQLMNAVIQCDVTLVQQLLDQGANPNIQDFQINYPIHAAISRNCSDVVLALLKGGANPNTLNYDFIPPTNLALYVLASLTSASQAENIILIIKYLADAKANFNAIDPNGYCPIHLAVLLQVSAIVKILLQGGSDPNLEDKDGSNPLVYAVYQNNEEILKMLIEAGSLNVECIFTKTPLQYAIFYGLNNLVVLLQNLETSSVRRIPDMTNCNRVTKMKGKAMSYILN